MHTITCKYLISILMLSCALEGVLAAADKVVWRFDGEHAFEQQGIAVHAAGDVDGDRVPDVITGLRTQPTSSAGNHTSARVYSGKSGAILFQVPAPAQNKASINAVAALGDLDGDGSSDVVVGTPAAGVVRIFKGSGVLMKTLAGNPSLGFGTAVALAGDTNGDRVPDLIVGAPGRDQAFVYSGVASGPQAFALIATIQGPKESGFGSAVGTAGALRQALRDTRTAVIVGAPYLSGRLGRTGAAYVFFVDDVANPVFSRFGDSGHDLLGTAVDGGRDVDGDQVPDFLAGAAGSDLSPPNGSGVNGKGYARVYSGADGSTIATMTSDQDGDWLGWAAQFGGRCESAPLTVIAGAPLAVHSALGLQVGRVRVHNARSGALLSEIWGENAFDGLGMSVGGFVDLNADSHAELLAGAHGARPQPDNFLPAGAAFVLSCVDLPRPALEWQPDLLSFGEAQLGASSTLTVHLVNTGDLEANVQSVKLKTGSSPAFSVLGPIGPYSLGAGSSQAYSITFLPMVASIHGGKLRAVSNDPLQPALDLPIVGTAKLVKIEVTPSPLAFGALDTNDSSGALLQVENAGNETLAVHAIDLVDPGAQFGLMAIPSLPRTLAPGEAFFFGAYFAPTSNGGKNASIEIASSDPLTPITVVPLSGSGVAPNLPPTAVIRMNVPYTQETTALKIPFRGNESFDAPPGQVVGWSWTFGDFATSAATNPMPSLPAGSPIHLPETVVRLEVTDNGGKKDPTSVSVLSSTRALRSRFHGNILQGGFNVPDNTVVEAWINDVKVAEALTQTHHGQSVFAIEVPPKTNLASVGGADNDIVVFKYNKATAEPTGVFFNATDQELHLTAPFYIFPRIPWCVAAAFLGLEVCGDGSSLPRPGIDLVLDTIQPPFLDPGPLKLVGQPFELLFREHGTGRLLEKFDSPYQIKVSYTQRQLDVAGVDEVKSLALYYLHDGNWVPAGKDALDASLNQMVTTLDHASIFALMGTGSDAGQPSLRRGDVDANGKLELTDAVRTLGHLFLGGVSPACMDAADTDDNGRLEISDPIGVLGFLFLGARAPAAPGPTICGLDANLEIPDLGCERTACR